MRATFIGRDPDSTTGPPMDASELRDTVYVRLGRGSPRRIGKKSTFGEPDDNGRLRNALACCIGDLDG